MSNNIDQFTPQEVGERLRIARESAKITQAAAADGINVARTTIVAIEQGQRRIRLDELQRLAITYDTSVNAVLRREAVYVDLKPRFRKGPEKNVEVERATDTLTRLVQAEIELESLLGVQRRRNDPPERPLLPGDVAWQAEQDAFELRQWLGLGLAPVHDIASLLELQLGAHVFVRKLPAKISGLYAYVDGPGACILLNAAHPRDRRAQTAAHELGHYISTRRAPDAVYEGSSDESREERYANTFARAFLTPARTVMSKFQDVTAGASQLTRRHVIILAHTFGVSREAMVRRLEELKLTKAGTWDWFARNNGITDEQARQVLGVTQSDHEKLEAAQLVPLRLGAMAAEAWRRKLLSEGQIARLLGLDRTEVREIVDSCNDEGGDADASLRLPI